MHDHEWFLLTMCRAVDDFKSLELARAKTATLWVDRKAVLQVQNLGAPLPLLMGLGSFCGQGHSFYL